MHIFSPILIFNSKITFDFVTLINNSVLKFDMSQENTPAASAIAQPKQKKAPKLVNFQNFNVGLVTALIVQPFEVIRTSSIMSLKNKKGDVNKSGLRGTIETVQKIWRMEGIKGFFRGGLLSLGKSALGAGVFFTGLENVHFLTEDLRKVKYIPVNLVDFINAASSRIMTTLIVNPVTVVKTRFEVVGNNQYKSIFDALKAITQKEGFKGFYKGITTTIMRDVPYSGLQYSSYRFGMDMCRNYGVENPYKSPLIVSMIGGISAVFAVMMTYPFDNMRVRYQCNDQANVVLPSLPNMAAQIYREEGLRGFYLGYVPRIMKKGVSSALSWVVFEKLRKDTTLH